MIVSFIFILVLNCIAFSASAELKNPTAPANKEFLQKQKDILRLFRYINQRSFYQDHVEIAKKFRLEENIQAYTKPEIVDNFLRVYQEGLLRRGEIFSIFYSDHQRQVEALFKLFYYSKDYDTFYQTAVWARQNINEGIFLYTLSVALVYRNDTYGIILPPIYETYPNYFFNSEVIQTASRLQQQYPEIRKNRSEILIYANYSGSYLNLNKVETRFNYFREDVGINSFYYYYNIYYPFWLNPGEFGVANERRGEQFYIVHQQLLARYRLERGGELEFFNWELPFEKGYYPSLRYTNGLDFPIRPNFAKLQEYFYNYGQKCGLPGDYGYSYSFVNEFEGRIWRAIDSGFVKSVDGKMFDLYSPEGFNLLGNLIESNANSPNRRYFGSVLSFARHLLGYSTQPIDKYRLAPSALEHFETSLRDPAFYQLFNRLLLFFQRYKSSLPAYTAKDLGFPGVTIQKVNLDRLVTYWDYFDSDISQAVYITPEQFAENKLPIKARQYRLNNRPFNYSVFVNSDNEYPASIRVYLGPKNRRSFDENRLNYYLLDQFVVDLKAGENKLNRRSDQANYYQKDRTSFRQLYQNVEAALNGSAPFNVDRCEGTFGFPLRYLLPRGSVDGKDFRIFVIASPFNGAKKEYSEAKDEFYPRAGSDGYFLDGYAAGYPFDRSIQYEKEFYSAGVSNRFLFDVKVYHAPNATISGRND